MATNAGPQDVAYAGAPSQLSGRRGSESFEAQSSPVAAAKPLFIAPIAKR